MFYEHKCGCIWSIYQGRVRICGTHVPEKRDGMGGELPPKMPGVTRHYPANGVAVASWSGK